eukprot:scaffold266368_cov19-Tisochrysis_lutea.AAC.1
MLCACTQVKYMWLRQQRSDKALLLASRAGGAHEPLFLRLLRTMGLEGSGIGLKRSHDMMLYCAGRRDVQRYMLFKGTPSVRACIPAQSTHHIGCKVQLHWWMGVELILLTGDGMCT